MKLLYPALMLILCISPAAAQQGSDWALRNTIPGKHRGAVSSLFQDGNEIFTAGMDGFLEIWNTGELTAGERYQLSPYTIEKMIKHPEKDEICLVENRENELFCISVWNYRKKEKVFSIRFSDPVGFINYSAAGNFIIAAFGSGFVFIDSQTGKLLKSPEALSASIAFAATGRTERSMVSYFSSGQFSYWDLASGAQTSRFDVLPNIKSPVLFSSNRYFAGVSDNGMVILDAVSGILLDRSSSIPAGSLLAVASDELYCLVPRGSGSGIYHFNLDRNGKLSVKSFYPVSLNDTSANAFIVTSNYFALGTSDGKLLLFDKNGQQKPLSFIEQTPLIAADVSDSYIAFLTADHELGFLPLDYTRLISSGSFSLEKHQNYTKINSVTDGTGQKNQFLLWQTHNTDTLPRMVSVDSSAPPVQWDQISSRFPLLSAQIYEKKLLLLDTVGNLSVIPFNGETDKPFNFFSIGSIYAAFINKDNVILCRSTISGNSPFLMLNVITGETVPLSWPSQAGLFVYRSSRENIYAVSVEENRDNLSDETSFPGELSNLKQDSITTSILKLDTANPAHSQRIAEYSGENTRFSLAEAESLLALTIDGEEVFLYAPSGKVKFERTPGLPLQLSGGGRFFIVLDTEGNIAWYSAFSGKLLAIFKLYKDEWTLSTEANTIRIKY